MILISCDIHHAKNSTTEGLVIFASSPTLQGAPEGLRALDHISIKSWHYTVYLKHTEHKVLPYCT